MPPPSLSMVQTMAFQPSSLAHNPGSSTFSAPSQSAATIISMPPKPDLSTLSAPVESATSIAPNPQPVFQPFSPSQELGSVSLSGPIKLAAPITSKPTELAISSGPVSPKPTSLTLPDPMRSGSPCFGPEPTTPPYSPGPFDPDSPIKPPCL